jgi:hypothetical protein
MHCILTLINKYCAPGHHMFDHLYNSLRDTSSAQNSYKIVSVCIKSIPAADLYFV